LQCCTSGVDTAGGGDERFGSRPTLSTIMHRWCRKMSPREVDDAGIARSPTVPCATPSAPVCWNGVLLRCLLHPSVLPHACTQRSAVAASSTLERVQEREETTWSSRCKPGGSNIKRTAAGTTCSWCRPRRRLERDPLQVACSAPRCRQGGGLIPINFAPLCQTPHQTAKPGTGNKQISRRIPIRKYVCKRGVH